MGDDDNLLFQIRATIPRRYFKAEDNMALKNLMSIMSFIGCCYGVAAWAWSHKMYVCYPFVWLLCGTALASVFVIAHDCGHYSFFKAKSANVILGHVLMAVCLTPFYAWKYMHDNHHHFTNRYDHTANLRCDSHDSAWSPLTREQYKVLRTQAPMRAMLYRLVRAILPIYPWVHFARYVYNPFAFTLKQRSRVMQSYCFLLGFISFSCVGIISVTQNAYAVLYFWLLPLLVTITWAALYTYLHHTHAQAVFFNRHDWQAHASQVSSAVNCYFPRWISILHGNIDIHIPHHISERIPSYYLRDVNQILVRSQYRNYFREVQFSWNYLWSTIAACKLWDVVDKRFVRF